MNLSSCSSKDRAHFLMRCNGSFDLWHLKRVSGSLLPQQQKVIGGAERLQSSMANEDTEFRFWEN